jgi:hypothetical protein
MASSPSSAPTQEKSESKVKPFLFAAVVFVVVTGAAFFFFRDPTPDPRRGSDHQRGANDESPKSPLAPNKPTANDDNKTRAELQRERLLENVGSVSAIQLYQSYLNVGLLADAVKNQSYTREEATEILHTILPLMQTVDAQTKGLEDIGLDEEEVAAVKQLRKISRLIKSQADHLQNHWRTGDKSSLDEFQRVRGQSWLELRLILGLGAPNPAKAS